jgi:hypothetical protein
VADGRGVEGRGGGGGGWNDAAAPTPAPTGTADGEGTVSFVRQLGQRTNDPAWLGWADSFVRQTTQSKTIIPTPTLAGLASGCTSRRLERCRALG